MVYKNVDSDDDDDDDDDDDTDENDGYLSVDNEMMLIMMII